MKRRAEYKFRHAPNCTKGRPSQLHVAPSNPVENRPGNFSRSIFFELRVFGQQLRVRPLWRCGGRCAPPGPASPIVGRGARRAPPSGHRHGR
jgi:hypothetical protein